MRRILFIVPLFGSLLLFLRGKGQPTGMPSFYRLVEGLLVQGYEVHIIVGGRLGINGQVRDGLFVYDGNPSDKIRDRLRGKFLLDVLGAVWTGLRHRQKISPGAIYGQQSYGALAGFLLSRLLGVPNITRLYGTLLYGRYGTDVWKMIRHAPKALVPFLVPSKYLVVTEDGTGADKVAQHLNIPEDRFKLWLNGVDREKNPLMEIPLGWPVPAGGKSLLWVSRLEGWKCPYRAIDLLAELNRVRDDVWLVIIGDGEDRHKLEVDVAARELSDRVIFVGTVSHRDVSSYMNACDVFLSLFDYSNLSNTVLEVMSIGKCVVALDEGGTRKVIRHGETGFLIGRVELAKLLDLVNYLLDNGSARQQVGQQAQAFIETYVPTWEKRIAREIALIDSLVAEYVGHHRETRRAQKKEC